MKKYILLALLLAPLSFNSIYGYGCCGGGGGWGLGAGVLGLGLVTAAVASRPRQTETIIIEKEAEKTTPQTDPLMMQQLNNLTLQMDLINYQLEMAREENIELRAQLRETQRK